jgi:hypothetical protein
MRKKIVKDVQKMLENENAYDILQIRVIAELLTELKIKRNDE